MNHKHLNELLSFLEQVTPQKWHEAKIQCCTDCKTIVATKQFPKHNRKHTQQDRLNDKKDASTAPINDNELTDEEKERLPTTLEMAEHARLYTYIPRRSWPAVQQAVRPTLQAYLQATSIEQKERYAILFHYNFRFITQRPSRGGKGKHAASVHKQIKNNLMRIQSPYMHPIQHDQTNTESKQHNHRHNKDQQNMNNKIKTERIRELLNQGHLSKATKVILQPGFTHIDQDTLIHLKAKHPVNPNQMPLPPDNNSHTYLHAEILDTQIERLLRQAADGSAPGPSGVTGAMLLSLARDQTCLKALGRLIEDIANAAIGPRLAEILRCCRLIGIPKAGTNDSLNLRPLAITEVLSKIAARHALSECKGIYQDLAASGQYGVGVYGGSVTAVHLLRSNLEHLDATSEGDAFLLLIDLSNAFNSISRDWCLKQIYANPKLEPIWALVNL